MKFSKAEVDAIIEASPRTFVPFNKLVLSEDHQARSATTPAMSLPELAASIKDSGVLQNLVVVQAARGRYEVCAGGRRLAALTLLVQQGDIADNYPVPVLVVPADKALIASLAENCFHVPMHPADEFAAFARLLAQGKSVEDVAAAFGVTPLIVKRRMKLATVSPRLMALYREGGIGLDCLMVLASVDDHQRQEQAWAGLPTWNQRPEHLRQLLTRGEIESDADPLARFVTVKAYEKAGGPLRRDLFSDDDRKAYLLDPALLERLAADKLGKRAKQLLSEGWKWVDIRPRFAYDEYVKHGELRKPRRAPTPEEAEALKALDTRIAALHEQMDALVDRDGDGDAGEGVSGASEANDAADEDDASRDRAFLALESEADGLEEERKARLEALTEWPVAWMALAGCVLHVGADGRAAIKAGLIRPEDRADLAQAITKAAEQKSAGGGGSAGDAKGDADPARGSGLPALQSLPSAAGATHGPCTPRSSCAASRPTASPRSRPSCWTARGCAGGTDDPPDTEAAGRPAPWRLPTAQPAGDQRDRQPARTAGRGRGHRGEPGGPAHRSRPHRLDRAPAQGTRRGVRLDAAAAAADGAAAADLPGRVHRERHHRHRRRPTGQ
jgi:ParB family chromosome partitioning protein